MPYLLKYCNSNVYASGSHRRPRRAYKRSPECTDRSAFLMHTNQCPSEKKPLILLIYAVAPRDPCAPLRKPDQTRSNLTFSATEA